MLVGFYQFKPEFGDKSKNIEKIEHTLNVELFDIIVLPELCTTGYQFVSLKEVQKLSESIPDGLASRRFSALARNKGAYIIAGIAENDGGTIYNSAGLFGPDGFVGKYRKIHLFFEETLFFTPGSEQPKVYDVNGARVSMLICFDWMFPEIFRIAAIVGADIIAQPANLVLPYCQHAMQTRSIENRIFTVTANRIGTEERGEKSPLTFTGCSQITDEKGNVLVSAGDNEEIVRIVDINPHDARDKRINRYNSVLDSRRPEMYAGICDTNRTMGD